MEALIFKQARSASTTRGRRWVKNSMVDIREDMCHIGKTLLPAAPLVVDRRDKIVRHPWGLGSYTRRSERERVAGKPDAAVLFA